MTTHVLLGLALFTLSGSLETQRAPETAFVYQGDGFTITLPRESEVKHRRDCSGVLLFQAPQRGRSRASAQLQLCLTVYTKPAVRSLAAWVDSARTSRNKILDPDIAQLDPAKRVRLGRLEALELLPYCGDCEAHEVYFANAERIVEVEYHVGPDQAGSRAAQDRRHRSALATFRWSTTTASNEALQPTGELKMLAALATRTFARR